MPERLHPVIAGSPAMRIGGCGRYGRCVRTVAARAATARTTLVQQKRVQYHTEEKAAEKRKTAEATRKDTPGGAHAACDRDRGATIKNGGAGFTRGRGQAGGPWPLDR
ncbi:hypothetical protein [Massilia sp. 9096]|uniref:hypothetical protein n=1 Tax=Massilia sp. 9096 TaxID=1500894 RepID=UPI0018CEA515|nr:hypothetical protein [Massilia sp. 9096]